MSKERRWPSGFPRVPMSRCPHCGKQLDAAGVPGGEAPMPKPGDLTVCFGCGEILAYDARMRLRKVTAAELVSLDPDVAARLRQIQVTIRDYLASE